jgi:hypothetical protein
MEQVKTELDMIYQEMDIKTTKEEFNNEIYKEEMLINKIEEDPRIEV